MKKYFWIFIALSCIFISAFCSGCFGPGIGDFEFDVTGGYKVDRASAHMAQVIPKEGGYIKGNSIPPKVVEVAWDDRFVIAKQIGFKDDGTGRRSVPDETKVNYWILDTAIQKAYGPCNLETFEKTRQFLGVSPDITLKNVHSYPRKESEAEKEFWRIVMYILLIPVILSIVIIIAFFVFLVRISNSLKRIEYKLDQMDRK